MTRRHEALMIGHGAVIFFIGLMSGYLFLFQLIGEINLWPIPGAIKVDFPADDRAWRAAHTGNIMNALMLIGAGLSLSRLRMSATVEKLVCWGLVISAWGNFGFYALSAMGATGRGLTFGPNRFGGGDLLSALTFLVAYPGAILAPVAMFCMARAAFAVAHESARGHGPPSRLRRDPDPLAYGAVERSAGLSPHAWTFAAGSGVASEKALATAPNTAFRGRPLSVMARPGSRPQHDFDHLGRGAIERGLYPAAEVRERHLVRDERLGGKRALGDDLEGPIDRVSG
jgi:hypothetical protein